MMRKFGIFLVIASLAVAATTLSIHAQAGEPYPLEYFALRDVVSDVEVSPDGKRVAMLKILSREGNPILHVYDASDLSKDPFVVNSNPMEIVGYDWVSDRDIVITLRQKVRDKIEGQNQGVYEYRIGVLDVENEEFDDFDVDSPNVEHPLPNDPDRIIISMQPGLEDIGIKR